jgi:hypothetical protein
MASRAKNYRQLARECRRLANTVSANQARRTILDMAEEWERLAHHHEQDQVQQQQQPQPEDDDKKE